MPILYKLCSATNVCYELHHILTDFFFFLVMLRSVCSIEMRLRSKRPLTSTVSCPATSIADTLFACVIIKGHVHMQHVTLGPQSSIWWCLAVLWGCWTWVPRTACGTADAQLGPLCRSLAGRLPAPPAAGKGTGAYDYDLLPHLGSRSWPLLSAAACVPTSAVTSNCVSYACPLAGPWQPRLVKTSEGANPSPFSQWQELKRLWGEYVPFHVCWRESRSLIKVKGTLITWAISNSIF